MHRKTAAALLGGALVLGLLAFASNGRTGLLAAGNAQGPAGTPTPFEVREIPAHTVLYTVHRGPFQTAGETFKKLEFLRRTRRMEPTEDSGICVYLKSTEAVAENDLLMELQIPVDPSAMQQAGRLQKVACAKKLGTTDVKQVAARSVAVAPKPQGLNDPSDLYRQLHAFVAEMGGVSKCPAEQKFPGAARIPVHCTYSELSTELFVPFEMPDGL